MVRLQVPAIPRDSPLPIGGKDRIPYPIDQNTYEQTTTVLQQAVQRARVQRSDKVRALKRLAVFKSFSDENKGKGVDAREK